MKYIKRTLVVFVVWFATGYVHADSWMSTEGVMLNRMTTALNIYPALHNGQRAMSWAQIREVYDLEAANKNLRGKASYPLQAHYEFINREVPYPGHDGSRVIMLRTVPLQRAEGQPKWRNLVVQTADGQLTATRRSEDEVQAMFRQAGVPLPTAKAGMAAVEIEAMPSLDEPPESNPAGGESTNGQRPTPATPTPQTPIVLSERSAPAWPWVIAVLVIGASAAFAWRRRAY